MGQNIPLGPVDQPHAVRRHWRRRLRRQSPAALDPSLLLAGLGMALAGAGLWLTGSPPPVEVSMDPGGYTIGGARLNARGGSIYESSHGVMVVRGTRSAASATVGSQPVTGACDQEPGSGGEHCRFRMAGRTLEADDQPTTAGWHRRYDDGQETDVKVTSGGQVPVPFPVGR